MRSKEIPFGKTLLKTARLFYGFVTTPLLTSKALLADRESFMTGFWWTLVYSFCFMISSLFFYIMHFSPRGRTFLSVSAENWYLLQIFTALPAVFAGVLSFTGLTLILARMAGGKGNFENAFPVLSFALLVPSFILIWIPEMILFPFLYTIHGSYKSIWPLLIETARVFILPGAWTIFLSVNAISRIYKIDYMKSTAIFFISSVPFIIISAVFIR